MKSAYLLGAERVIGIDVYRRGSRWRKKKPAPRPSTTKQCDIYEALREMTGGRGPDSCIDAVGSGITRAWTDVRL